LSLALETFGFPSTKGGNKLGASEGPLSTNLQKVRCRGGRKRGGLTALKVRREKVNAVRGENSGGKNQGEWKPSKAMGRERFWKKGNLDKNKIQKTRPFEANEKKMEKKKDGKNGNVAGKKRKPRQFGGSGEMEMGGVRL